MEYLKYLDSIINDPRSTCEITSRIAMAKAAFNQKETFFTSKLDLNLKKKLLNSSLGASSSMVLKLGLSENRFDVPLKLRNVVLEKDG
jgi:hypothetical protein